MEDGQHKSCPNGMTQVSSVCSSEPTVVASNSQNGSVKPGLGAQVTSISTRFQKFVGINRTNTAVNEPRPWKTSFWRLAPLSGIFCMCLAVASIVAALGILAGSRGAATTSWTIPPSTYLAVCTAVSNQAIRFAAFHGLAIAWWSKAAKGTTLQQLHSSWRAGMTVTGAVLSGRGMGLIGLACLFSTLVSVDGPFIQKATTIRSAPFDAPPVTLNVTLSQEQSSYWYQEYFSLLAPTNMLILTIVCQVPRDSTGGWYKDPDITGRWSTIFNKTKPSVHGEVSNLIQATYFMNIDVEGAWFRNDPIPNAIRGCPHDSKCKATVRAPALAMTSCVSKSVDVDYWVPLPDLKHLQQDDDRAPPLTSMSFVVDFTLIVDETESINLITGHSRTENCSGTFHYNICTLRSAIGEYNVTVENGNQLTLDNSEPRIIALANNTKVSNDWSSSLGWYRSTLGGIVYLAYEKWESVQQNYYQGGLVWQTGLFTNIAKPYVDLDASRGQVCASFVDPQKDVLLDLNRLMFMLGAQRTVWDFYKAEHDPAVVEAAIDPGLPLNTTTLGYLDGSHDIFVTNMKWWGAAAIVELVCVALILPTYFGWWKLGRSVSFSPLEVAKSFEAPLLSHCNSNSSGKDLSKALGDIRVQYGETRPKDAEEGEGGCANKLAFADPRVVSFPRSDTRFDS